MKLREAQGPSAASAAELAVIEIAVEASCRHQLIMAAALDYAAVLHHQDQIRIADGQRLRHHHLHMDIDVLFLRAADLGVQDGVDDLVLAVSVLAQLLAIPQQPGQDGIGVFGLAVVQLIQLWLQLAPDLIAQRITDWLESLLQSTKER